MTLPADPQVDREFAGLLRAAAETMGVVSVAAGSELVGATPGALDATVVAVRSAAGTVEAIPSRSLTLAAGDAVYAVGRPETLRRLEGKGRATGSSDAAPAESQSS